MSLLQAVILGVVQGLTEFLPVSSSGHLVLAEKLMGVATQNLRFEVTVHLATALAVCVAYRRKIGKLVRAVFRARIYPKNGRVRVVDENLRLFLLLVLATVPGALVGYLLDDLVEKAFANPVTTSIGLVITGTVLYSTRFVKRHDKSMNWWRALAIGLAQAVAILPGISRSGSTIATGILAGIKQERAAEFSFLLSVPIILGAGLVKLRETSLTAIPASEMASLIAGAVTAGLTGFLAIKWLLKLIKQGRFDAFSYYCWIVGVLGIIWFSTR